MCLDWRDWLFWGLLLFFWLDPVKKEVGSNSDRTVRSLSSPPGDRGRGPHARRPWHRADRRRPDRPGARQPGSFLPEREPLTAIAQDRQGEAADTLGVGDQVDRGDLPAREREGETTRGYPPWAQTAPAAPFTSASTAARPDPRRYRPRPPRRGSRSTRPPAPPRRRSAACRCKVRRLCSRNSLARGRQ